MEEKKQKVRSIYDTSCIAYLFSKNVELATPACLDSAGKVVFLFPDTEEVNRQISEFYNKTGTVVAIRYAENLRLVRALISSTKTDRERGGASR